MASSSAIPSGDPLTSDSEKVALADANPVDGTKDPQALVPPQPGPDFPEGGLQAWLTVLGACVVSPHRTLDICLYTPPDFFVVDFLSNYSSSQISWIGSIAAFLSLSSGLFAGRLFDSGYFYVLMIFGGTIAILCIFMLSLAEKQQYYQAFLSLGLGCGIGFGAVYVPSIAICTHYFHRRRALAMGIAASGTALGAMLHPIMLNNLIHGKTGFANGVRASGGLIAGCFVIGILIMRTRLPPRKTQHMSLISALQKFVKDDVYIATVLGLFLVVQGVFFPLFYIQLYCDQHGIDQTFSFYTLTIISAASWFGRIGGGAISQRAGVFNSMLVCSILTGTLVFAILGLRSIAAVTVWAIIYGFFSGAVITLLGPLLASLATDVSEVGLRMGLAFGFTGALLLATPITGALLGKQFLWWRPVVYIGVSHRRLPLSSLTVIRRSLPRLEAL
ncbi:major facilitator superfamily domain-containing protein [Vararia minispora EC-137]|uniref:Major facilitator superfamily domain-containing protein n=1 Tax=Vararia minispora EC-137 TaxID=1314806 RepID=A0ACB8QNK3_9AGAM|nr:major facilitator superfamily domain-containing protein [Vararia minispora EC-137]